MKIYKSNGTLLLEVDVDDTSYRSRQIMGDYCVVLNFALPTYTDIPVGSYIDWQNTRFALLHPQSVKMQHTRDFEYSVTFHTDAERAKTWIFKNTVDGRISFTFTATPREHLQMFIDNMNRRDSGWSIGECISGEEKTISYDKLYCSDALALIASECETEYEFVGKKVHLKKIEYNKENPLALTYGGTGAGFKSGISRSNGNGDLPLEILYVQGGDRNIDPSKYPAKTLLLPNGQIIGYDGTHFSDESGYIASKARKYKVSSGGDYVQRQDKALSSMTEASLDLSDIYPSRVGVVGSVIVVDAENHFYDFTDSDPASDPCPDYGDCLIEGEKMTVIFQTGMLAGKEFDVAYYHHSLTEKGVVKAARRFEIVPADIDGVTMPDTSFKPVVGDKYIVFHCQLPSRYICDNTSKSGASWRMYREAVKYFYDNEEYKFTFNGTLDGLWAKRDWVNIGGKIKLGGYVSFTDERMQPEAVLIRITNIKDYINDPHSPEITISNETATPGFGSAIKKIEGGKIEVDAKIGEVTNYNKRGFRDAMETSKMLQAAMIDGFTQSISPITAQMMQLIVGDERLQFEFMSEYSKTATPVSPSFYYDYTTGIFSVSNPDHAEYIAQHLTLDVVDMQPEHNFDTYYFWGIHDNLDYPVGDNPDQAYYVYLECPKYTKGTSVSNRKTAGTYYANFVLSATIKPTEQGGKYYFLSGILTSEFQQNRSFSQLYGFTEITGGRITTDRIVSKDGNTYFDLQQNKIAGTIQFLNGLISGLIGIGNESAINAGLSGDGSSTTDIRIWAGEDIRSRTSAPFRVQHDGKMYASNAEITGKITATSGKFTGEVEAAIGKIGGFAISNNNIINTASNTAAVICNQSGSGVYAGIGSGVLPSSVGANGGGRFECTKSGTNNVALYLNAENAYSDNSALFINKGWVTGLNLHVRTINASTVLQDTDTVIVLNNTEEITITLSGSAPKGKIVLSIKTNETTVSVMGRIWKRTGGEITTFDMTGNDISMFFFDGSYWHCCWTNNRYKWDD